MILQSKLKTTYHTADPDIYLTGDTKNLDPIFAGRLAYVFKVESDKQGRLIQGHITDGHRTHEDQERLYKKYRQGLIKLAEMPGRSWHEFSIAVDISSQPIRSMTNLQLKKYGLCKPIASEGWHIQPIETLGQSNRTMYAPTNLSGVLKMMFSLSDNTIEYLEKYKYAYELFNGLISGRKTFSDMTMDYLRAYEYWASLKNKLGIIENE